MESIDTLPEGLVLKPDTHRLNAESAAALKRSFMQKLVAAQGQPVVLDLTEVTEIDSTGVSLVVGTHKECEAQSSTLTTALSHDFVIRVFEVMRLDKHLSLVRVTAA